MGPGERALSGAGASGQKALADLRDERFIGAALAACARAIASYDGDLLSLEKPFGIALMRPAVFLARMDARD